MNIDLIRYSMASHSSLGMMLINGAFACYTLEDKAREVKVMGETCIPAGCYRMDLRTEGGQNQKYLKKFPDVHKGMLHLRDVPNFNYIHLHIGNTIGDTDGCILLGDKANNNTIIAGTISDSTNAYKRIYPRIAKAIADGKEEVWITIADGVPHASPAPDLAKVNVSQLNMRIAPNSEVVAVLKEGTRVQLLETNPDWCKVNLEAWVAEEFLDVE